jgi:F-type H+-transporting ATPase subunit b
MDTIVEFAIANADSFFWSLGVFVIFVVILLKVAIKPVHQALVNREQKIARELKESEDAYEKAKSLQAKLDQQLADAESRISEMLAEGRRDAEAQKEKILEAGRREAEQLRDRALREITSAKQHALLEIKEQVAEIAVEVAGRVLQETLGADQQSALIKRASDAVEASAGGAERN